MTRHACVLVLAASSAAAAAGNPPAEPVEAVRPDVTARELAVWAARRDADADADAEASLRRAVRSLDRILLWAPSSPAAAKARAALVGMGLEPPPAYAPFLGREADGTLTPWRPGHRTLDWTDGSWIDEVDFCP